jgi:hypothetical protein
MELLVIILLALFHFIAGFGILMLLKIYLKPALLISLSVLIGIGIFSFIPFLMQLLYVPLTGFTVSIAIGVVCILLNLNSRRGFIQLLNGLKNYRFRIKLYEIPFLLLISLVVFVSVWRCYYLPPTPRDLTSGPEVIAEYAVKEKSMINSVFTVDLATTNNQFKPPFITCLQIIYKYAGFPFGQVWLSLILISFLFFLYGILSFTVHKIVAGLLMILFIAIPEMYAYTFMVLFDYSNSVFFCLSLYFLFDFFKNRKENHMIVSGILMGIATYIRSETLVLACFIFIAVIFHNSNRPNFWKNSWRSGIYFILPSLLIYLLSIVVYINWYLPSHYTVETLLNKNLLNFFSFYQRLSDTTGQLLLAGDSVTYYGYFVYIFLIVLCLTIFDRNYMNKTALNWLFAVLTVYIGLPFIAYLFPLYDLDNSTKRGLFKIFPLMLMFMANSPLLISLSDRITKWEQSNN